MQSRWQQMLGDDPAYSPCLSLEAPAFSLDPDPDPDPDTHALVLARNSHPVYPVECMPPVTRGTFPESQMYEMIALSLTPLQQIAPLAPEFPTTASHAAVWRASSGSDPQVELGWQGETLSDSWSLLAGELSVYRGRMFAPVLYPTYRVRHSGEAKRIDLPLNISSGETRRFEIVVRLLTSTTGIRFDPSVATVYRSSCRPRSPSFIITNRLRAATRPPRRRSPASSARRAS